MSFHSSQFLRPLSSDLIQTVWHWCQYEIAWAKTSEELSKYYTSPLDWQEDDLWLWYLASNFQEKGFKKKSESFPNSTTGNAPCWKHSQLYSSSMKAVFCHLFPLTQCRRRTSVSRAPGTWNTQSISVSGKLACAKAESSMEPDTISECLYACTLGQF